MIRGECGASHFFIVNYEAKGNRHDGESDFILVIHDPPFLTRITKNLCGVLMSTPCTSTQSARIASQHCVPQVSNPKLSKYYLYMVIHTVTQFHIKFMDLLFREDHQQMLRA